MRVQRFMLFTIIALCLTACKEDKTVAEARRIVKEWTGKTVLFPDINAKYIAGDDSLQCISEIDTTFARYKVLIYVDSAGCTSCKLRLYAWKAYMQELNTGVDFMFYFQLVTPRKRLWNLLKRDQFTHPVYIDNKNEFRNLNKLSKYLCFLLDSSNKVLLVGDPTNNPQIKELYKKVITGEISDKPPITTIEPEQTEIELNDLHIGKTSDAIFSLKNTGTQPLIIQTVNASCGCTVPEWDKQPVATGKSTKIKVRITPEEKGYFNKTITVHCNTKEGQILLKIKGTVP
ncbi:MAG: DUF1573 domain-containing protein [Bacteroidales bacterium]|jgi:hypothetical protein|nr:DUF1573 domain-containing protein [Bacteroidales bacterium]